RGPPRAGGGGEAGARWGGLGAVDGAGRLRQVGVRRRELPLPPRLARMVVDAAAAGAAELAADVAVLLTERGLGGSDVDLPHRLDELRGDRSQRARDARAMAKRWAEMARAVKPAKQERGEHGPSIGILLALAYPDRIAKNRGAGGAFLLANGRGANVDPASALA